MWVRLVASHRREPFLSPCCYATSNPQTRHKTEADEQKTIKVLGLLPHQQHKTHMYTCSSLTDKNPFRTWTTTAMLLGLSRELGLSAGNGTSPFSTFDKI